MKTRYLFALIPSLILLYPLSFGPAVWMLSMGRLSGDALVACYRPLLAMPYVSLAMDSYGKLWLPSHPLIHVEFPLYVDTSSLVLPPAATQQTGK